MKIEHIQTDTVNKLVSSAIVPKVKENNSTPIKTESKSYSYDKEANVFVVKFIESNDGVENKVVKQYPPENMIALAKDMNKLAGNVIDIKI